MLPRAGDGRLCLAHASTGTAAILALRLAKARTYGHGRDRKTTRPGAMMLDRALPLPEPPAGFARACLAHTESEHTDLTLARFAGI